MFQRKRERKGDFTGDLGLERGHLVHMLPIVPKAQDHAREATAGEKAPSSQSARKQRETVRNERHGGGGGNRTQVRSAVAAGTEGTLRRRQRR